MRGTTYPSWAQTGFTEPYTRKKGIIMGILESILAELQEIKAALANGGGAAEPARTTTTTKKKETAPAGPTLEEVSNRIRELVAADDDNKGPISEAIKKLGGKRAGDFEGDPKKLKALFEALEGIGSGDSDGDDLL